MYISLFIDRVYDGTRNVLLFLKRRAISAALCDLADGGTPVTWRVTGSRTSPVVAACATVAFPGLATVWRSRHDMGRPACLLPGQAGCLARRAVGRRRGGQGGREDLRIPRLRDVGGGQVRRFPRGSG